MLKSLIISSFDKVIDGIQACACFCNKQFTGLTYGDAPRIFQAGEDDRPEHL
ncbi:MAG: hypothetical protein U9R25_13910 [Chloroflexota bacterium]|nr:hypothetical protein [Chloroflexota bacterium]